MIGNLNETQVNNILSSQVIGRLACSDGNQPYVVPLTYAYDGKFIYGQAVEGKKLGILRKNPNVCFEVDMMTNMANWQSVIVFGIFEELKKKEAEKARELLLNRVFPLLTSSTIHPNGNETGKDPDDSNRLKPVMYRIRIKKMTGRFEKQ
jgi:uncharacterized protein